MLLGEPPPAKYDVNFSVFGFPVRIAAFFWLAALILGSNEINFGRTAIFSWILAVLVSILIHELGHAFAHRYYGFTSHIVLYHFGGLAIRSGSEWQRSHPKNDVVISLAGPLVQMTVAVVLAMFVMVIGYARPPLGPLSGFFPLFNGETRSLPPLLNTFVQQFQYVSIYWGLLNLLPVYPLDGGQIARNLFLLFGGQNAIQHSLILSTVTAAVIAIWGFQNGNTFFAIMFGLLGYSSYQVLQSYGGGFGSGHGRRW